MRAPPFHPRILTKTLLGFISAKFFRLLEKVWQNNLASLRAVARHIVSQPDMVDDILQESFRRLLQRGKTFHNEKEALAYARRTVYNTSLDHYRLLKRHRRLGLFKSRIVDEYYTAPSRNPEARLLRKEGAEMRRQLLSRVQTVLGELEDRHREALDMVFAPDRTKSIRDLCAEKGIAYSTLRSRVKRALNRIQGMLDEDGPSMPWAGRDQDEKL